MAMCTHDADAGYFQDTTPCQSDDDCSISFFPGALCVFDWGCSSTQGHCVSTPYCYGTGVIDYCGCDGHTFQLGANGTGKQYPDRPYAHVGACP